MYMFIYMCIGVLNEDKCFEPDKNSLPWKNG